MSALAYATLDDLAQWVDDDLPTTAPSTLRSAAYAVAEYTATAVYSTDSATMLPLDAGLAAGFRDATCAQAAWMIANDISPFEGGATPSIEASVGVGTARITYADSDAAAKARAAAANGLCPEARKIISFLGLRTMIFEAPIWRRAHWGDIV